MEFDKLVGQTVPEPDVSAAIADLLSRKRTGAELEKGSRVPALHAFIETELSRPRAADFSRRAAGSVSSLNEIFRQAVAEAWGYA